jgi:hypothetical protein
MKSYFEFITTCHLMTELLVFVVRNMLITIARMTATVLAREESERKSLPHGTNGRR